MKPILDTWWWMVDHPIQSIIGAAILNGLITHYFGVKTV